MDAIPSNNQSNNGMVKHRVVWDGMIPCESSLEATSRDYLELGISEYSVRYSKIRVAENTTAILIRLIIEQNGTQAAAWSSADAKRTVT